MSTSDSYDSTSTMAQIVSGSFSLLNVHDDGETLPAEMWTYGKRQLNLLINFLSVHKGLWLVEDYEMTLTPGIESYSIGVGETIDNIKPLRITHARRSESIDIPIKIVSREDYMGQPNKSLQAPTLTVYYHPGVTTGTIYVWPTGTSTDNTIKLTIQRPIQDFDVESDNPDLPREWIIMLEHQLAVIMAPKYKGGNIPPGVQKNSDNFLISLLNFDEEITTVSFQP